VNDVFANGRGIACRAGSGKAPAAFPDVCMTPPENPATPPGVPVPYPNTGMESDTSDGSRTVVIHGQEVMLKNKSYYKKSMGDEAGCAAKKGVVTSVNRGKVYFIAWSMDVKFEGENVDRHLDLTTHNHASPVTNTPPFPDLSTIKVDPTDCPSILAKEDIKITAHKDSECRKDQQSDHIVQNACFVNNRKLDTPISTAPGYSTDDAPCICLFGKSTGNGEHGRKTRKQTKWEKELRRKGAKNTTYAKARDDNLKILHESMNHPPSAKALKCIQIKLDEYFKGKLGLEDDSEVRIPRTRKFKRGRKLVT
jgi:hypothetical protein